jgi:hypothetical protein
MQLESTLDQLQTQLGTLPGFVGGNSSTAYNTV